MLEVYLSKTEEIILGTTIAIGLLLWCWNYAKSTSKDN